MKQLLILSALCSLLSAPALAQTKNVTKTISTNGLVENLVVPSGKTLTINAGGSIINNGTATGFTANAVWGGITGTLSSQIDLQSALDAKLATSTAASSYQPLDGDLTSIAALTTTSFGRELLTRADAAATRSALGLGTLATQSATITDYLTSSNAALTYQPLDSQLTSIAALADASGVLTNNGSGTFSYTATSTGGNTLGTDAGKIAVYGSLGEFSITSALRIAAGPSVMGIWFNNARLASAAGSNVRTWTLPDVTGTLITTGDTGTVTSAMLASGAAASLGANTFTGLQQFSGTDHAGLRLNNLTTTQRDAIGTPTAGMIIWNTTAARIQAYNGSAWTAGMVRLDGDTMTGALGNSTNGALNAPAVSITGTAITGGTATTTKPLVLIEPTGTTSNNWSTSGTLHGLNAVSGFAGNLADYQVNGVMRFRVPASGQLQVPNLSGLYATTGVLVFGAGASPTQLNIQSGVVEVNGGVLAANWGASLRFSSTNGADLIVARDAAAVLQFGVDASSPVAQTLKAHDGSGTNIDGASLTLSGGTSTGTGDDGDIILRSTMTGSSGSAANSQQTRAQVVARFKNLTEGAATDVVSIALASGKVTGGTATLTVWASDGTDHQALTSEIRFAAVNQAGTVTATCTQTDGTTAASTGTLTVTYDAIASGNNVILRANATSSLTQTTLRSRIVITALNGDDTQVVSPQ